MENPAEVASAKLAREVGSWKSIELRLHNDYEEFDRSHESGVSHYRGKARYIETADGRRMYDQRLPLGGDSTIGVSIGYWDGSRSASLDREDRNGVAGAEQVVIKRTFLMEENGFTHRPEPLWSLYAGLEPLHQSLSKAELLGERKQLNHLCDLFLVRRIRGGQDPLCCVYWLDRVTAMPLRVETFDDESMRADDRPSSVWTALSLDEVHGHHLALKSEVAFYAPRGPKPRDPVIRNVVVVDEVTFDREYPRETFWPTITEKTTVIDYFKNTISSPQKTRDGSATAEPIRAVDGSLGIPSAAVASLVLGVVLLVAGMVVWWRRP